MMIVRNTINRGSLILKKNSINSNLLDAELILSDVMKVDRNYLLLNDNLHVSEENRKKYYHAIKRRSNKEPIAYIFGKKEFWSINFPVNKATLIPRPETELLVDEVIKFIKNKKINILDIGTGCGCILISLLKELKTSNGVGLDISSKAINLSSKNAKKLNVFNRISFKVGDIDGFCYGKYDLIVSNPPYIAFKDLKNLSKEITNYEPLNALNGGIDGLDLIRKVIYKSKKLLKKSGILAIEIGNNQYKKVSKILNKDGYRELSKVYDFNNNVRCIISTKI